MEFAPTLLTEEEDLLRLEVRTFLAEQLKPGRRPSLGMNADFDPEFSRELATRGWVGMAIPTEYGGHGRSPVERFVVTDELLAAGAPIMAHFVADRQTAPTILRFGSEELRQRFIPRICAGECYFSLGMSEPDSGSDLASVRTRATKVDGGWSVSGTKVWTSGAHRNHYFCVLCRTSPLGDDRHAGLSQLIVDLKQPGVRISPIPFIDGSRHFNEVVLEDVFVPDDMVLGEPGDGWLQVTSELAYERSGPDRYLSTFVVLRQFLADVLTSAPTPDQAEAVGRLTAWTWTIRQMSLAVARQLERGDAPAVEAALMKDIGTTFEQMSVEVLRIAANTELDPDGPTMFDKLLAQAVLTGPSFTLRGGTTEVLRSIAAKGLGR